MKKKSKAIVAIVMGSDSDLPTMNEAAQFLQGLHIPFEIRILSAHRTPDDMAQFAKRARSKGLKVIIAGAGGAAHLPGMIAAHTIVPVIGVPIVSKHLQGHDSLLSIVQMPAGIPVATVAIGGGKNAGILAAQILGTTNLAVAKKLEQFRTIQSKASRAKNKNL